MFLKVHELNLTTGRPVAILNEQSAKELNVHVNERVYIKKVNFKKSVVAIVDISTNLTDHGVVIASKEILEILKVKKGEILFDCSLCECPRRFQFWGGARRPCCSR